MEVPDALANCLLSMSDALLATDADGRITALNPSARRLLDVEEGEALGRPHEEILKLFESDDKTPVESPIASLLAGNDSDKYCRPLKLLSRDGRRLTMVSIRGDLIKDAGGRTVGTALVLRDMNAEYSSFCAFKEEIANRDATSAMAHIYYFRLNTKTLAITGSDNLSSIWPVIDGKAAPIESRVYPEDVAIVQNAYNELLSGRKTQATIQYRVRYDDSTRIYQSFLHKVPEQPDEVVGLIQDVTDLQELSESRRIITSAFELLFSVKDLAEGIRVLLKMICEYIGFTRAYICCVSETKKKAFIYAVYVPEGEESIFEGRGHLFDEEQVELWYPVLANSKCGESFDCDFSNEDEAREAVRHIPALMKKYREFDLRGAHINYITINDKPWGSVGYLTQHKPVKKLSENEQKLLEMIAHVIEIAMFRERMVERLEIAVKDAQAADKAKSFFLASMSHEIRTPLNAVIGFADLLKDNNLDIPTQQEYLSSISLAGNALLQLVNDILDLSKLEAGQVPYVPEKTNLTDFCREIAAVFSHSANQKNLKLEFVSDGVPYLYIDQQRIRQVLFNLVGNSIKFTSSGGIKVVLSFERTGESDGTLSIRVSDTGVGVAPEDRKRLFQPFIQLTKMRGTNAANNGTGLGLPIVQKMITQIGGKISLESELGKGSTFLITLPNTPMEVPAPEDAQEEAETIIEESAPRVQGLCPPNQTPRILLVDDIPLNIKILSSMLKHLNIYNMSASSGAAALEMLKADSFNIVLTDLLMPEMSGEELARIIRGDADLSALRIALVSAEQDKTAYDSSLFDVIMQKPISRKALYSYIYGE